MSKKWLKIVVSIAINGSVLIFWGSEYYNDKNNEVARQWILLFAVVSLFTSQICLLVLFSIINFIVRMCKKPF